MDKILRKLFQATFSPPLVRRHCLFLSRAAFLRVTVNFRYVILFLCTNGHVFAMFFYFSRFVYRYSLKLFQISPVFWP